MKLCRPIMILWVMGALLTAFNTEASNARYEILYAQEQLSANVVEAAILPTRPIIQTMPWSEAISKAKV